MTSFVVAAGTTQTTRISMGGADDLTVEATGSLSVASNAQSVRFNAVTNGALITNNGTIENTAAGGRAIRFETTVGPALTATIDNAGIIQSPDDAIQIQGGVTSGTLTIHNSAGTIQSTTGQAIDLAGGTGAFVADITNDASILALAQDAIRFGGVGILTNSGTIDGGSSAGYTGSHDGIQFEDNSSGLVTNTGSGTISGDRHGINGGNGTIVDVVNSGTITGRNGSGVGLDGSGSVTNHGTITGAFSDSPGSDVNGPLGETPDGINDGDGDGVDIDGHATIDNYGLIQGTGAGGNGSDGLPNTSEGIAAGGGSITNHAGATISGLGLGILIDDSSQGNAPFQTSIVNDGTISGINSTGIRIVSTFADTIVNNGTISGGGGVAILFGAGDNTLSIGAASSIVGLTDGEGGANTLDYSSFGYGGVWVNLASGAATGTGGVLHFQSVFGSAGSDVIIGDGADNSFNGNGGNDVLAGGDGADTLAGGAGHDVVTGGDGNDILTGGSGLDLLLGGDGNDTYVLEDGFDIVIDSGGAADLATSTISRSLLSVGLIGVEGLTLLGAAADGTGNHLANLITGNDAANTIDGGLGNDTLLALGGKDILIGGFGTDTMTGGLGDDVFRFSATAHSAVGAGADVITDFDDFGDDRIDLSALAGPALAYRHDLAFSGARQVRINDIAGDDVIVEVNLGGSLAADMQIRLTGTDFASMTASDFLL